MKKIGMVSLIALISMMAIIVVAVSRKPDSVIGEKLNKMVRSRGDGLFLFTNGDPIVKTSGPS